MSAGAASPQAVALSTAELGKASWVMSVTLLVLPYSYEIELWNHQRQ